MHYLERPYILHCCKDGTITYRTRNQPIFNGRALPVFSVDTEEDAQAIQLLLCSLQYGEHPDLPGQPWYRISSFGGELEDLEGITEQMTKVYKRIQANQ